MADFIEIIALITPFFGLIALGFACAKWTRRPAEGLAWMQFFIIYVALPCMFFKLIAGQPLTQLANARFAIATTLATAIAFALALGIGLWHMRSDLPQAVMQGAAGAYSNIGYMGPPLILAAIGPAASPAVVLIFVFDNLFLFSAIPFLMALAGVEKRSPGATALAIAWQVASHPFNVAILAALAANLAGLTLPAAADKMVTWLANAAAPCALFLLGVTVALRPLGRVPPEVPGLVLIKLVLHPLIVWVLVSAIGDFEPAGVQAAVIMAALPPALNIFVVATQYRIGVERASACVLVGTLVSVVTLTAFLWLVRSGAMPADLF